MCSSDRKPMGLIIWLTDIDDLCWRSLSFVSLTLMVLMTGIIGTEV